MKRAKQIIARAGGEDVSSAVHAGPFRRASQEDAVNARYSRRDSYATSVPASGVNANGRPAEGLQARAGRV